LGSLKKPVGQTGLPEREAGIKSDEQNRNKLKNQLTAFSGFLLFVSGAILFRKFWWDVSFNFSRNVNVAYDVVHFLTLFMAMAIGAWLVAIGISALL
jgi:hypothetical protein